MAAKTTAKAAPAKAMPPGAKSVADAKPACKAAAKPAALTVTTKQLPTGLAERQGMDKKQAEAAVVGEFGVLAAHLRSGDRVRIAGLDIMQVKNRPARMGCNPATGEAVQIKASKTVAFQRGKGPQSRTLSAWRPLSAHPALLARACRLHSPGTMLAAA